MWRNEAYYALSAPDKEALSFLMGKHFEAEKLTGAKNSLAVDIRGTKFVSLPGVTKTTIGLITSKDPKAFVIDKFTDMWKVKADEAHEFSTERKEDAGNTIRVLADVSNKEKLEVPIPFRQKLKEAEQSTDLHSLFLMNLDGAKNYEVKEALQDKILTLIDVMSNRMMI